jgi:hypothetical protein
MRGLPCPPAGLPDYHDHRVETPFLLRLLGHHRGGKPGILSLGRRFSTVFAGKDGTPGEFNGQKVESRMTKMFTDL